MSSNVTYKYIRQNPDIHTYIKNADAAVKAQGYTEHSFAHVEKVADTVKMILEGLGYDERKVELGTDEIKNNEPRGNKATPYNPAVLVNYSEPDEMEEK